MSRHARAEMSKERYDAVTFDLDGILTRTAKVHKDAWRELFDEYRGGNEKRL
jgi:trehalose 6-phosphate phosphatase